MTTSNLQKHDAASTSNEKSTPQDSKTDTKGEGETKQQNPRVKYRESKLNENGIPQESDTTEDKFDAKKSEDRGQTAVEVLRIYGDKNKYQYTKLKLVSPSLNALVIFILAYHPWMRHMKHDSDLWFSSPYEDLVHSWDLIQDVLSGDAQRQINKNLRDKIKEVSERPQKLTCDAFRGLTLLANEPDLQAAIGDLKAVSNLVEHTPDLQTYFQSGRDTVRNKEHITWDLLWTIFPPGELVFAETYMKQPQIFIIVSADSGDVIETKNKKVWRLDCWAYDWDGNKFNRVWAEFGFLKFKDEYPINSLLCYPLKYHSKGEEIRQGLLKRGQKFCTLASSKAGRAFEYQGFALQRGEGFRKMSRMNSSEDNDTETLAARSSSREDTQDSHRITVRASHWI